MNNTAGDSPLRRIHNNTEISKGLRWEVVEYSETGCNILILLQRAFLFTANWHQRQLLIDIVHDYFVHVCTHLLAVHPPEDLLLCSHMGTFGHEPKFYQADWPEKLQWNLEASPSDICTLTYSPSRECHYLVFSVGSVAAFQCHLLHSPVVLQKTSNSLQPHVHTNEMHV